MNFSLCENTGFFLRMGLIGPAGSGKTYTALKIATEFGLDKIGIIDTESKSARRYAKTFSKRFQSLELDSFSPQAYIDAIQAAEKGGIEFLVIDSLSHAWIGNGGVLNMVEMNSKRSKANNSFTAWRDVTPEHNRLVEAILRAQMHIIVTMRTKTEYVVEQGSNGKSAPRKIGLAPVQREGLEYEFDIIGEMDQDHNLLISKTRCPSLSGEFLTKPGSSLAQQISNWVNDAEKPIDWVAEIQKVGSKTELEEVISKLNIAKSNGTLFSTAQTEQIRAAISELRQSFPQGAVN